MVYAELTTGIICALRNGQHTIIAVANSALRNPEDDYSMIVFDEKVRGKTDRFILVFEK